MVARYMMDRLVMQLPVLRAELVQQHRTATLDERLGSIVEEVEMQGVWMFMTDMTFKDNLRSQDKTDSSVYPRGIFLCSVGDAVGCCSAAVAVPVAL